MRLFFYLGLLLCACAVGQAAEPAAAAAGAGMQTHGGDRVQAPVLDYRLAVALDPHQGRLQVELTLDAAQIPAAGLAFALNADLSVEPGAGVAQLRGLGRQQAGVALRHYRLRAVAGVEQVQLRWSGPIGQPLRDVGEGLGRRFETTPGLVSEAGVYLSGSAGWFPLVADARYRFELTVSVPDGWQAVSQGRRLSVAGRSAWQVDHPQDDIYLIAGRYTRYQQLHDGVLAEAYLRHDDKALAQPYLDATARYVRMYAALLGDYPYAKFALVENFWESGYGMPSFTLLGPQVLRLPFIIHTSYPHEILHNWWGNGVFVDYAQGNWSEGLTAYLSDHLLRARRGKGAAYRRATLQRFADLVDSASDFPLVEFRGRHGPVSQAVGYGKTLMVFHMLRQRLGDRVFIDGLRRFYAQHRFTAAGWAQLQQAMEVVSGQSLVGFFEQWLQRRGAPQLSLAGAELERDGQRWRLRVALAQAEPKAESDPAWQLRVPLLVQLAGEGRWRRETVTLKTFSVDAEFYYPSRPLRLRVDPLFDVFRLPLPGELPPALSGLFGSPAPLVVVPARATSAQRAAWQQMVAGWARRGQQWQLADDDEIDQLPAQRSVLLLGWDNRWRPSLVVAGSARPDADADAHVVLAGRRFERGDSSVVLVEQGAASGRVVVWIGSDSAAQAAMLARKLPHYGKYGYLAFRDGAIAAKGQWPVTDSPLALELMDPEPAERTAMQIGAFERDPPAPLPQAPALTELVD